MLSIIDEIKARLTRLTKSVILAESIMNEVARVLISGSEVVEFSGNDHELRAAMARLAARTRSCVTVAVVVGRYHRRGCLDRRGGGYDPVGN